MSRIIALEYPTVLEKFWRELRTALLPILATTVEHRLQLVWFSHPAAQINTTQAEACATRDRVQTNLPTIQIPAVEIGTPVLSVLCVPMINVT